MREGVCSAGGLVIAIVLGCSGSGAPTSTSTSSAGATGSGGATTSSASSASSGGTGASSTGTGGADAGVPACLSCSAPVEAGTLGSPALNEISGVVASAIHPGVFYVHNDSGDTPRFFAIDAAGALLATFTVAGAQAVDWEDLARGPCPAGSCLYLADIGDNPESRSSYTIYRVPEPASVADATVNAEALPFTYGDGSHNSETLLVEPTTGVVTLVTKVFVGASSIYELPLPLTPGVSATATKVGTVQPPSGVVLTTGGDVRENGVLLRTYSNVWLYPKAPATSVASALAGTPCMMPVADEAQGEAVGWLPSGKGYVTIGEGAGAKVNRVDCGP
jgi:hypothetical protein